MDVALGRGERRHPGAEGTAVLDLVIWLMISSYLFVDSVSGLLREAGLDQALLSQAWKGGILVFIFFASLRRSVTSVLLILLSTVLLTMGPLYRLFTTATAADFGWEAATALKPLLPLAVLTWCNDQQHAGHDLLRIWPRRALWAGVAALLLNLAAGAAGLGFSTYSSGAGDIGITGYFYAGNEVGATLAVLCGFVYLETWTKRRGIYLFAVGGAVLAGFAVATKAAILSALLLAPLIPLAYQRGRWLRMPASLVAWFAVALALLTAALIRVWSILETAGLADKLAHIYNQRGWSGILFSGRDLFLAAASKVIWSAPTMAEVVFGPGINKLNQLGVKESVEMDPLDFYLWFGAPGLVFVAFFAIIFLYVPKTKKRDQNNDAAPGVYVTTAVLLGISVIAGHVILGGLAGIAWAVLTALVFSESRAREHRQIQHPVQKRLHEQFGS